jgi:hypothetical protein
LEPGAAELRAALITVEKTAVICDADLCCFSLANRNTLNKVFTVGLKVATKRVAWETSGNAVEAIRLSTLL